VAMVESNCSRESGIALSLPYARIARHGHAQLSARCPAGWRNRAASTALNGTALGGS